MTIASEWGGWSLLGLSESPPVTLLQSASTENKKTYFSLHCLLKVIQRVQEKVKDQQA